MTLAPWLSASFDTLARAIAVGRVHHGLLLAAPAGLRKRELADAFAASLLCSARDATGQACGHCRSCTLLAAGTHPDLVRVGLELRDDGRPRTEILIDQLRRLAERLALSSQFGGWQVAIVDPADRMNAAAANALLKTLEEPASDTVIVLVADDASRLPATIRSRCQRVDVPAPDPADARAWLVAEGVGGGDADAALAASLGNPGLALEWVRGDALTLRAACIEDLAKLAGGGRSAVDIAQRWAEDRPELRLWFAATLARDEAIALSGAGSGPIGLTAPAQIPKLVAWFGQANRMRGMLSTALRGDLLLLDLLCAWPSRRAA